MESERIIRMNRVEDQQDAVKAKRVLSEIRQGKRKVYSKKQFQKITGAKL